jgi:hypothetical protein
VEVESVSSLDATFARGSATVDSKRLTTSLDATFTRNSLVTPVDATLTKNRGGPDDCELPSPSFVRSDLTQRN